MILEVWCRSLKEILIPLLLHSLENYCPGIAKIPYVYSGKRCHFLKTDEGGLLGGSHLNYTVKNRFGEITVDIPGGRNTMSKDRERIISAKC